MDKNMYEAYEYLPANSEVDADQFFVVQDDGTFLINRQVQYVAQVQDVNGVLDNAQNCTVYDVSPQQFFVDVENSTEMISVPDNYILPVATSEETSHLYSNSYLLQPAPDSTTDQVDVTEAYKETQSQEKLDANIVNGPIEGCTEVTLSDEQYKMLQDKGWILLETNDKVFVLNTLGLHDITSNSDLIEQYKAENQATAVEQQEQEQSSTGDELSVSEIKLENLNTPNANQEESELVIDHNESDQEHSSEELDENIEADATEDSEGVNDGITPENNEAVTESQANTPEPSKETAVLRSNRILRIKTNYTFKEIPDKIILGKTARGTNLVAKVTKRSTNNDVKKETKPPDPPEDKTVNSVKCIVGESTTCKVPSFQMQNMVAMQPSEHVAAAGELVSQLVKIPAFRASIVGRNVIITRSKSTVAAATIVTGSVEGNGDDWRLVHKPGLLQQLHAELGEYLKDGNEKDNSKVMDHFSVLHIHVAERNGTDSVSITLNKRHIPMNKNDLKKRPMLYACSTCADIFKTDSELAEHQEMHNMEDSLTIDTANWAEDGESSDQLYYTVNSGNGTQYACLQCNMHFNKQGSIQRHIKTHRSVAVSTTTEGKQTFQCKLCPSSYFYSSSLAKHFFNSHIKTKQTKVMMTVQASEVS